MTLDEYWSSTFTSQEKLLFQRVCRTLLKRTFIVRDKDEDSRKMYFFASKYSEFLAKYFSFMGFDIAVSKDAGVVMLQNYTGAGESAKISVNKYSFKKTETIVLCCLWSLYSEKIRSGSLSKQISVTLAEINIELDKFDFKENLEKGRWSEILGLFARFNLIAEKGEIGSNDFCVVLFPSLQFALDEKEFAEFVSNTEKKFKNQNIEDDSDSESDETDEPGEDENYDSEIDSFDIDFDESNGGDE